MSDNNIKNIKDDWNNEEEVDLKEKLVEAFVDECNGVTEYLDLANIAKEKYPNTPYSQIFRDIAKEERVHKNHIKAILKDMSICFTDKMDEADMKSENDFNNSFQ